MILGHSNHHHTVMDDPEDGFTPNHENDQAISVGLDTPKLHSHATISSSQADAVPKAIDVSFCTPETIRTRTELDASDFCA